MWRESTRPGIRGSSAVPRPGRLLALVIDGKLFVAARIPTDNADRNGRRRDVLVAACIKAIEPAVQAPPAPATVGEP
jgi:hypothetical protein